MVTGDDHGPRSEHSENVDQKGWGRKERKEEREKKSYREEMIQAIDDSVYIKDRFPIFS